MNAPRDLSSQARSVVAALLQGKPDTAHFINTLDNLVAMGMDDGQMGSLTLLPNGVESAARSFGKQIVSGEFTDSDGVPVSITINVDGDDRLYELDVWKVNFAPLIAWPDSSAIKIVR
jgi:hypothetical protein